MTGYEYNNYTDSLTTIVAGLMMIVCFVCVCVCVYVCAFVITPNRGGWPVSHQWIGETHPTVELHGLKW